MAGEPFSEMIRLAVQAVLINFTLNMDYMDGQGPCAGGIKSDSYSNLDFVSLLMLAALLFISDIFLRMEYFTGMGMEIIKYFIQGMFITFIWENYMA
jgi:hypothetical protein